MPTESHRVVLDTNILVRALINHRSDSGRLLHACERRRVIILLSRALLSEYRYVLNAPILIARYPELKANKVKTALERLMYVGDIVRDIHTRFDFPRDRKDEKLLTLAIAGRATDLVTTDHDLLDLPQGKDDAARRFRQRLADIAILSPDQFVRRHGQELDI